MNKIEEIKQQIEWLKDYQVFTVVGYSDDISQLGQAVERLIDLVSQLCTAIEEKERINDE